MEYYFTLLEDDSYDFNSIIIMNKNDFSKQEIKNKCWIVNDKQYPVLPITQLKNI